MIGMAAMLSLTTLVACSRAEKQQPALASGKPAVVYKERGQAGQTVPGSYIVKASGDGTAAIRKYFAQYGVMRVNSLGHEQYEMRLERDPGIDVLQGLATGSNGAITAIQPNFIYHAY
ncbi:MAG: hypothetical protein KKH12_15645 [Gammaproteobacteria bacterium]|nr:hypothetical protein [Gammaproteobacteria bacterium]